MPLMKLCHDERQIFQLAFGCHISADYYFTFTPLLIFRHYSLRHSYWWDAFHIDYCHITSFTLFSLLHFRIYFSSAIDYYHFHYFFHYWYWYCFSCHWLFLSRLFRYAISLIDIAIDIECHFDTYFIYFRYFDMPLHFSCIAIFICQIIRHAISYLFQPLIFIISFRFRQPLIFIFFRHWCFDYTFFISFSISPFSYFIEPFSPFHWLI